MILSDYLLLAQGQMIRIDIFFLKMGKEELHWRCTVAMWPREEDRDLVPLIEAHHVST